jgi:hypothetical protein
MCSECEKKITNLAHAIISELDSKNIPDLMAFYAIERLYVILAAEMVEYDDEQFYENMERIIFLYDQAKKEKFKSKNKKT